MNFVIKCSCFSSKHRAHRKSHRTQKKLWRKIRLNPVKSNQSWNLISFNKTEWKTKLSILSDDLPGLTLPRGFNPLPPPYIVPIDWIKSFLKTGFHNGTIDRKSSINSVQLLFHSISIHPPTPTPLITPRVSNLPSPYSKRWWTVEIERCPLKVKYSTRVFQSTIMAHFQYLKNLILHYMLFVKKWTGIITLETSLSWSN